MKYMRDIPLAIATPLLAPVKGLETDWFFSYPRHFTEFEASVDLPSFLSSNTSVNRNETKAKAKTK